MTLLYDTILSRLSNYKLSASGAIHGAHKGQRRSQRPGSSMEFSDYRLYVPGDDIRRIDWNTYARTNKHYIKRFLDEREINVHIYLDCSKSMGFYPEKWRRAKQLTGVFSFLSLSGGDRLSFQPLASTARSYPLTRGKALVYRVLDHIEQVDCGSEEHFGHALRRFSQSKGKSGVSIVISDFLESPEDLYAALRNLQMKRQSVLLLRVLSSDELDPQYIGDLQLNDVESGMTREVSMGNKVVSAYKSRFAEHTKKIDTFCRSRGIGFATNTTAQTLGETVFSTLAAKGWIE